MAESKSHFVVGSAQRPGTNRTIFSFNVDNDPRFTYQAWHLARSLVERCGGDPSVVHVHCTPDVSQRTRNLFRECGYHVYQLARSGEGRNCNKLDQLETLRDFEFDCVVLLDTDMIAISDIRPFLSHEKILGVTAGFAGSPLTTFLEIAIAAGLTIASPIDASDRSGEETDLAKLDGRLYSVPKAYCDVLSREWRLWALWLFDNMQLLTHGGRLVDVDQVSFWLAVEKAGLPFAPAPSNVNYHVGGDHLCLDETHVIALVHYHAQLNVRGLLEVPLRRSPRDEVAVARANQQIGSAFDNRVFWDMRYRHFPERGSGAGSRGENLLYKRRLLREQGIEEASSVLDFGCGDIEVLKELNVKRYIGIDQSSECLEIARRVRPDWEFRLAPAADVPPAQMVLCMEVLIHQETEAAYKAMIAVLAEKTLSTLLVSGFSANSEGIRDNPNLFFYEPLEESFRRTGRFRNILPIGAYPDVVVYRCDV